MNEREKLKRQWKTKTGETMPQSIAVMPVDRIRRAVALVLSGATVFVPADNPVPQRVAADGESMQFWDYGSPG